MGRVITVSGAVGGVGTSTVAYALAQAVETPCLLIDAQPDGTPLDVAVGIESQRGARWSQVRIQSDSLDAESVLAALPSRENMHVLAADGESTADARAMVLLTTVMRGPCDVVIDVP